MAGSYAVAAAARHRLRRRVAGQVGLRPLAVGGPAGDGADPLVVAAGLLQVAAPVPAVGQAEQELGAGVLRQPIEVGGLDLEDPLVVAEALVEELGPLRLGDERGGGQEGSAARDAGADAVGPSVQSFMPASRWPLWNAALALRIRPPPCQTIASACSGSRARVCSQSFSARSRAAWSRSSSAAKKSSRTRRSKRSSFFSATAGTGAGVGFAGGADGVVEVQARAKSRGTRARWVMRIQ
jgi:hypothetical protein